MWAAIVVTQTGALCARAQAPETGDRRHDWSAVDTPSTHGRFVPRNSLPLIWMANTRRTIYAESMENYSDRPE